MEARTYRVLHIKYFFLAIVLIVLSTSNASFSGQAVDISYTAETTADSNSPTLLLAQGLCNTFVGEYVTNDHAIRVRNDLQRRGFNAWIEHHGSYLSGTRTYVVFAMLPCR